MRQFIAQASSFMVCMPAHTHIAAHAITKGPCIQLRRLPKNLRLPVTTPLRTSDRTSRSATVPTAASLASYRSSKVAPLTQPYHSEAPLGAQRCSQMGPVASILGKIGRVASAVRYEDCICTFMSHLLNGYRPYK